jgi:Na+/glutamate symporter
VGETAVTILEGVVVSAAVSAAFAALGLAGAPAVAIGIATVGVTWLADVISESITGKKVAELVSDSILDAAESIEKKLNVVKEIKKQVGPVAKSIKNGVSSLWKNAARRFSFA